jgi:hypothetical protein
MIGFVFYGVHFVQITSSSSKKLCNIVKYVALEVDGKCHFEEYEIVWGITVCVF